MSQLMHLLLLLAILCATCLRAKHNDNNEGLADLLLNTTHGTVVSFRGRLFCPLGVRWCADWYYCEGDRLTDSEFLAYVPLHCTDSQSLHHQKHVFYEGGDGPADNTYEPYISIKHNCSSDGYVYWKSQKLQEVDIHNKFVKSFYTVNVEADTSDWENLVYGYKENPSENFNASNDKVDKFSYWVEGEEIENRTDWISAMAASLQPRLEATKTANFFYMFFGIYRGPRYINETYSTKGY